MVPQDQGIEGWLWTSTGGSALTQIDPDAPDGALLFTKPLGPEQLKPVMDAKSFEALAARTPLGVPTVPESCSAAPTRRAPRAPSASTGCSSR